MGRIGRIVGWRASFQALLLVTLSLAVLFPVSRGLSALSWLPLYQNQFAFTPGDWLAWRLNDARLKPQATCILVGASTIREGLSAPVLEGALRDTTVVNLATTASHSAIDVIEVQARILASLGDRYKCIVVGLHPLFLRKFDKTSYNLVTTDYAALLSAGDLFDLAKRPWLFPDRLQLGSKYFLPLGQQSLILKRLIRLSLYDAHRALLSPSRPRQDFEEFDGEFVPQPQYNYAGKPSILADIEESYTATIKEIGWDRANSYGGEVEASALRHAMRLLSSLTDRLIVVEMPESHLFKNVDAVARAPYESALSSSNVSREVLRCVIPRAEELDNFHDAVHLNEHGRKRVSLSIAQILSSGQQQPDDLCRIREQVKRVDAHD